MIDIESTYDKMIKDRLVHDEALADSDEALDEAEERAFSELYGDVYEVSRG